MKDRFIKWLYIIGSMFVLIPIIFVGVNVKASGDLPDFQEGQIMTLNFEIDNDNLKVVNKHDRSINYYRVNIFNPWTYTYDFDLSFLYSVISEGYQLRLYPNYRLMYNFYDTVTNSWLYAVDFSYIEFNFTSVDMYSNDILFWSMGYGDLDHISLYAYDNLALVIKERYESGLQESNINLVNYYNDIIANLNAEIVYYSNLVDIETNVRLQELAQQKQYYEDLLRTEKITAYEHGYNAGQTAEFDGSNWLVNTFLFVGTLFNLELIPGVKIGYIALIPISIAIVRYVLGLFGGRV